MALVTSTLLVATAAVLPAQTAAVDARWRGWVGCWQTTDDRPMPARSDAVTASDFTSLLSSLRAITQTDSAEPKAPIVCTVPASGRSAVDVVSIVGGQIVSRQHVDANGERFPIDRDGCAGWQQATWSADGERVFLRSELGCGPGLSRSTSGVLAMSATGEWLDVQGLKAGGNNGVRVARYRAVSTASGVPAEIAALVPSDDELARRTARAAAGAALQAGDVVEATKQADAEVIQSFLYERGQRFSLDARTLISLADAGVPGAVTDMMVAVTYSDQFAIRQPTGGSFVDEAYTSRDSARIASQYLRDRCGGIADPMAFSPFGWGVGYDPFYTTSLSCSRYGYGSFYGNPRYGYSRYQSRSPYGYQPYYGGYVTNGPVIVVRREEEVQHGKVVNGRGYSRPRSSDAGRSSGTSSTASSGSSGSSSSTGGASTSSGSTGTSSGTTSSSTGRTAVPRPPL